MNFEYISNGRMYEYRDGDVTEIGSGILESYKTKVKDSAERNEWKYTGTGAAFTGTFRQGASADDAVSAIYSFVNCIGTHDGDIIYSLDIDNTNGIYRKPQGGSSAEEGIVLCSSNLSHKDFDIRGDLMVATSAFAGESHIGVLDMKSKRFVTYTEGHSLDVTPVWSRVSTNKIYFCCIGLPEDTAPRNENTERMNYGQILNEMYAPVEEQTNRGPSSICVLDISRGTLDEVLADNKYDYTHPASTRDGSIYYIRKPYSPGTGGRDALGCLVDIVMLPVRLFEALFGFLNVFSAKYSGKTLSRSNVKSRDEGKMFIDGNLINAERELKNNAKRGDKNPGIIPRSWELRRLAPNGEDSLVRAGVTAFRVDEATGDILFSNGSAVLKLDKNGKEERIVKADKVTFII